VAYFVVGTPFPSTFFASGPPRSAGENSSPLSALALGAVLASGAVLGLAEASALGFSSADLTLTSSSDYFTYLSVSTCFSSFSSGYSPAAS